MNRVNLVVDVHEPGDADNAIGTVLYRRRTERIEWRCLLCPAAAAAPPSLAAGLDGLIEHLEMEH